jgi:hypothetical protein
MKILIIHATIAPSMDGPTFLPAQSLVEVETDAARAICAAGKALFVDAKDDPTTRGNRPGLWTATESQVSAVRTAAMRKATPKPPEPGTTV